MRKTVVRYFCFLFGIYHNSMWNNILTLLQNTFFQHNRFHRKFKIFMYFLENVINIYLIELSLFICRLLYVCFLYFAKLSNISRRNLSHYLFILKLTISTNSSSESLINSITISKWILIIKANQYSWNSNLDVFLPIIILE